MSGVSVAIDVARPEERRILENMMPLYVHDFSEFWSGLPTGELDADGRFPDYPLDPYWREPDHIPLLLRIEGNLVGFALLNAASHTGAPVDRNMAEFFIVRKHRRLGAGAAAAAAIFSRYPGVWETAVARRNLGALPFWRRTVTTHPQAREIEELDRNDAAWNGPLFRFRIAT